jgi:hypothetical protein
MLNIRMRKRAARPAHLRAEYVRENGNGNGNGGKPGG